MGKVVDWIDGTDRFVVQFSIQNSNGLTKVLSFGTKKQREVS